MKTREELEKMGINFSAENNNELHPSVNRSFVLKCKRCGSEKAREISEMLDYNFETHEGFFIDYYYCPNCKLKVEKYKI